MSHLTIRPGQRIAPTVREPSHVAREQAVAPPDTFTPADAPVELSAQASSNTSMIEGVYQQVLGRASDPAGLQHWEAVTSAWRAAGMNDEQIRTRLVQEFMASDEYRAREGVAELGPMIEGVYQEVLGRPSDPGGLENWTHAANAWRAAGMTDSEIRERLVREFNASEEGQARQGGGTPELPPVEEPAPIEPQPTQLPGTVDTGNYIGGNYTDLGRVDGHEAMPNPLDPGGAQAMRDAAGRDLDRLAAQGVDHVRVWAQHPNGLTDPAAIGARIRILAEEAQKRGMTLTVDLFDNYAVGGRNVDNYRNLPMDSLISNVVGANAGFDNIQWSLGNEIGDHERPLEFAQWYEDTAAKVRQAGGPGTVISAQLVPGSVNHPWVNATYEEAARRIIAASDVVSVHAYPEGPVGSEPWMSGIEQRSTEWYARATQEAGKKFTIGEFGLPENMRTRENIDGWLRYYEDVLGADHVSLWQFMKDDVGHLDPMSWDLITGNHTHLDDLRNGGWLGRDPH